MSLVTSLQLLALLGLLGSAVFMDLRERRIPNTVTMSGLLVGLVLATVAEAGIPTSALAGSAIGLLVFLPLLALGGMGGGDVKLLTAVGAFVGPHGLLSVVLYGALAGGGLALGSAIWRRDLLRVLASSGGLFISLVSMGRLRERPTLDGPNARSIPYGLAIAVGALGAWFFPLSLGGLIH